MSLPKARKRKRCSDRDLNIRPDRIKDLETTAFRFITKRIAEHHDRPIRLHVIVFGRKGTENHQQLFTKRRKIKVPDDRSDYWVTFPPCRIVGNNELNPSKERGELIIANRGRCIRLGTRLTPAQELYWNQDKSGFSLRFDYRTLSHSPELWCDLMMEDHDDPCRNVIVYIEFEQSLSMASTSSSPAKRRYSSLELSDATTSIADSIVAANNNNNKLFYTVEEELALAKEAAARFDKKHQSPIPIDPQKHKDEAAKSSIALAIFTDIEGRNARISDSPPSGIGAVTGVLEPGKYGIVDTFKVKMLMPRTSKWEDDCASWTLSEKGGGGEAMILNDAKSAVPPQTGISEFVEWTKKMQTKSNNIRMVGDAISYDYSNLNHWMDVYRPDVFPLHYCIGTRDFKSPEHVVQLIVKLRHKNKRPPYDPADNEALNKALAALGFKHDHNPVHDAELMYASVFIASFYETNKTFDKDGKTIVKREYDVQSIKTDGVAPGKKAVVF